LTQKLKIKTLDIKQETLFNSFSGFLIPITWQLSEKSLVYHETFCDKSQVTLALTQFAPPGTPYDQFLTNHSNWSIFWLKWKVTGFWRLSTAGPPTIPLSLSFAQVHVTNKGNAHESGGVYCSCTQTWTDKL